MVIPTWAYEVVQTGKRFIDKTAIQEYLEIFRSTFGFFRILIYGKPKIYFVYITNGLEPKNIKYIAKLFEAGKQADNHSKSNIGNRPLMTKLSDIFEIVCIGKDSIPVFKSSPMLFYQLVRSSCGSDCRY
jgi:hypothetical protein